MIQPESEEHKNTKVPGFSSSRSISPSSSYEPISESPDVEFKSHESSGITKSVYNDKNVNSSLTMLQKS